MIEIKDLLFRIQNIVFSREIENETVRSVISEVIGIQIKKEDLKIRNNTIYLNIKPIYKNEILLKKDKIMSKLEDSLKQRTPRDIR